MLGFVGVLFLTGVLVVAGAVAVVVVGALAVAGALAVGVGVVTGALAAWVVLAVSDEPQPLARIAGATRRQAVK